MNPTDTATGPFVGRAMKRREDPRLLVGKGRYIADIRVEHALEMHILRSPLPHARIVSIDAAAARRLPGVVQVLTHADIAGRIGKLPALDYRKGAKPAFQSVLADQKVRWVGEPVAVILAADRYVAEDAADLVSVHYESLAHLSRIEDATAPAAPLLYEEFGTNVVLEAAQSVGDADAAFASATHVFRDSFRMHRQAAVPMETRGVIAEADPASGCVTLTTSTQFPHRVRSMLAEILAIPEEKLRVIAPDVGGGFGLKEAFYAEEALSAHLALSTGRPIRWIEDRREHFGASSHAREQYHEIEAAVSAEGRITGLRSRCWTNIGGAFGTLSNAPGLYCSCLMPGPYNIPAFDARVYSVVTNKSPLNVFRGAGHPQAVLVMERMIDRIARELSLDRVKLRLMNMIPVTDMPSDRGLHLPSGERVVYDSGDYSQCLEDAARLMDYAGFQSERDRLLREGRLAGMGIAFYVEGTGFGPYETAGIRLDAEGRFTLLSGSSPHGQGTATTHAQMVADELGVPPDTIAILHGDTGVVKDGIGTWGSRGAAAGGSAARLAAQRLKEKAVLLAASLLNVAGERLAWENGAVAPCGEPGRALTWRQLAQAAAARSEPLGVDVRFGVPGVAYAFAAHIAVVEIDTGTGRIQVIRYGVAHDCGKIINPTIVAAQIVGGIAQGIGTLLFEEMVYDRNGLLQSQSLMDYLLPTVFDIPDIQITHRETPSPHNPTGIKGVGEGGTTGATAAVANAVQDALAPLGILLSDSGPYTPSKILDLLRTGRSAVAGA